MATATDMADETRQEAMRLRTSRWRNFVGYIFGDNPLIGAASIMLLIISGFATWSGMTDFIVGAQGSGAESVGKSIGGIEVTNDAVIISIVVALTLLMWLALREAFGRERTLRERLIMMPLYAFLALWSVGFGYGFWWSLIAGQEATKTSMAAMQNDARDATGAIAARLEAVRIQLDSVVSWSDSQMQREERSGGSCGIRSGAGRGPLYNARASVRDSVASLRDNITQSWIGPVQTELERLRQTASTAPSGQSLVERQAAFEARASSIRSSAKSIAARSNELGTSTASEMRALAQAVAVKPGETGFSCYDPTLAQRLSSAAEQAAQPAVLDLREAAFNEGPAGVANAVKNLWANIGEGLERLLQRIMGSQSPDGRDLEGQPITGRDLIALLATLGVDLGLFALTALNPPHRPIIPIHTRARAHIRRAIERAGQTDGVTLEWIRKHIIHHRQKSYLVIPNLYSTTEDEREKALAMNKLAGVLDDLRVVRWPHRARFPYGLFGFGRSELQTLKAEETIGQSDTDISDYRRELLKNKQANLSDADRQRIEIKLGNAPHRNHGLFSKAEVALESADWSDRAQGDLEVFVLNDTEGLTPLLEELNALRRPE
ncbi:MAG: hypothetical protein AAFZ05_07130 [Pseudomonadota bacterium]